MVFLLFLAGVAAVFFWYLPLIQQNERFRKEIFQLDTKIVAQEKLGRHLKAQMDATQNDPRALERLAREKLGYARTNEIVVHFEPAPPRDATRR